MQKNLISIISKIQIYLQQQSIKADWIEKQIQENKAKYQAANGIQWIH
ncbi:MAG: hypothetical protein ACXWR0_05065 [Bdellovibrio sp.]